MRRLSALLCTGACIFLLNACTASVPTEISVLHEKQQEIMESLQKSHLAMIDSYVDQKIVLFEEFFFKEYAAAYLSHWKGDFKTLHNRDYDEARDFPLLYNDLVAEYLDEVAPIEDVRAELRDAINREYRHAFEAHRSTSRWLSSLEKLNSSQRAAVNSLLDSIKPGLSLDSIDAAVEKATGEVKKRLTEITG